jgi:prepilin-type N-terminal cleavage/methylation domain-containing protein
MLQYIRQNQSGFSLIEVIVAMVLIGTIGAAFTGIYYTGIKASANSKQKLVALEIAQDKMEKIRADRDAGTSNEYIDPENLGSWVLDSEERNGVTYVTSISSSLIESNLIESNLVEVIIKVEPEDASMIRLGTRFFID